MAVPQPTAKKSVDLASASSPASSAPAAPRPSRIRRDPPPAVKAEVVADAEEQEQWALVIGILVFAAAIFVIVLAAGRYAGWSPAQYTLEVNCGGSGSEC